MPTITPELLSTWHRDASRAEEDFVGGIPKIELHIHLEGTLTPSLRWELAQKHQLTIRNRRTGRDYGSLEEMEANYYPVLAQGYQHSGATTFFEDYMGGFQVLRDEDDFFQLAMNYFKRAAAMNIRYCEVFFDPQGHTTRGVPFQTFMSGLRRAKKLAESQLNVTCQYIACMLRDMEVKSALEHYSQLLPYRDVICGIGLDSLETGRPPSLFEPVFDAARKDGFRITCHCDIGQKDTLQNIEQVLATVGGGTGADRCDHGICAVESPELVEKLCSRGLGMTLCPWCYVRYADAANFDVLGKIRLLYDAGAKITINSDDPGYMEDMWLLQNLRLVRQHCGFTDFDIARLQLNAVDICWASEEIKDSLRQEIEEFCDKRGPEGVPYVS